MREQGGWQPIATAPRDGTRVLAVNDRGQFVVDWDEDWGTNGWWQVFDGKFCERPLRGSEPTHWMPLPNPPEAV